MTWNIIRLELARTKKFPEGSPAHAYVLHLPLTADGQIDEAAWALDKDRATVRRQWPGEADQFGKVIRLKNRGWAFSYEPGEADDEPIFHLETHPLKPGNYVTIRETDGESLTFKVVSAHP
jgi:hypothetical protein